MQGFHTQYQQVSRPHVRTARRRQVDARHTRLALERLLREKHGIAARIVRVVQIRDRNCRTANRHPRCVGRNRFGHGELRDPRESAFHNDELVREIGAQYRLDDDHRLTIRNSDLLELARHSEHRERREKRQPPGSVRGAMHYHSNSTPTVGKNGSWAVPVLMGGVAA